jgi:hypothetical protein
VHLPGQFHAQSSVARFSERFDKDESMAPTQLSP